jgi:Haem-binding domain
MNDARKPLSLVAKCLVLAFVLLVAIQFVPVDNRNPPVQSANTIYSIEAVPQNVRAIFESSCTNCHSNQTRWPWYSHVAPFSWIVVHDVHRGRNLMNFSEWGMYSPKKRDQKLEDICDQLMNGDMPDGKYLLIHRKARLSEEQKEAVCQWTQAPR